MPLNQFDMNRYPLIALLQEKKHVFWENEQANKQFTAHMQCSIEDIIDAENRLIRFSSYIKEQYPLTKLTNGLIESDIKDIPSMKKLIEGRRGIEIPGQLYLKTDHTLPIAGSVKARGGIYEVLAFAEKLALEANLIQLTDDYARFKEPAFQQLFQQYTLMVGSTGNLGLSIGLMGSKLGFHVVVHMSSDAKRWKKDLLREQGVEVIEHNEDYSQAVKQGRKMAEADPYAYFIDDENSKNLFIGYAVAALRLPAQLKERHITVDEEHPLFVYLPCGVGGAPGGIAYGLKYVFGENVHIFFGEPMQSPCMLLGMMTGLHDEVTVQHIGLTNVTEADGLAVGKPSRFVGKMMENVVNGCYTVDDSFLFRSLKAMYEQENIFMEPSAHAAVYGPIALVNEGRAYIEKHQLTNKMDNAAHLVWSTGGDMVPHTLRQQYLQTEI